MENGSGILVGNLKDNNMSTCKMNKPKVHFENGSTNNTEGNRQKDSSSNGIDGYLPVPKSFATIAIHTAQDPEKWDSLCIAPPIVTSSTFKMYSPAVVKDYEYGRISNPTRDVLEECLAKLENGKFGLCFSSGLGAITALLNMFKSGENILCCNDIYGGTFKLFDTIARPLNIDVQFIDCNDLSNIEKHITPKTRMMWIETPTNPLLKVLDIKAIAEITKRNGIWLGVDNTFLTPYFQRPLELGADLILHSITKYINGHADVIMGAIVLNDEVAHKKLRNIQGATGIVPSPFDCYQVIRSLKTLEIRMKKHNENGLAVAKFLESHPKIERVIHPGLPSHPQHELFKKQTSGHSGIISCYIKGGFDETSKLLSTFKVFTLAESLGGYDSLVNFSAYMTHGMIPKEHKEKINITDNLIRFSVGLENIEDLIEDIRNALEVI